MEWGVGNGTHAHGLRWPRPAGGLLSKLSAPGLAHYIPSQRLLPGRGLPVHGVRFRVVVRLGAAGLLLGRPAGFGEKRGHEGDPGEQQLSRPGGTTAPEDSESAELGAGAGRCGGAEPSPKERVPGPTPSVVWQQLQVKVAPAASSLSLSCQPTQGAWRPSSRLCSRRCPGGSMALALVSREHPFPGPFWNWKLLSVSLTASWVCDLGEDKLVDLVMLGRGREAGTVGSGSSWPYTRQQLGVLIFIT